MDSWQMKRFRCNWIFIQICCRYGIWITGNRLIVSLCTVHYILSSNSSYVSGHPSLYYIRFRVVNAIMGITMKSCSSMIVYFIIVTWIRHYSEGNFKSKHKNDRLFIFVGCVVFNYIPLAYPKGHYQVLQHKYSSSPERFSRVYTELFYEPEPYPPL